MALALLVGAGAYASYNFQEDRQTMREMIAHSGKGDVQQTLQIMRETGYLANPMLNIYFQIKKHQYMSRFVEQDEQFDPISTNAKINRIVEAFRKYWNGKLLSRLKEFPRIRF